MNFAFLLYLLGKCNCGRMPFKAVGSKPLEDIMKRNYERKKEHTRKMKEERREAKRKAAEEMAGQQKDNDVKEDTSKMEI